MQSLGLYILKDASILPRPKKKKKDEEATWKHAIRIKEVRETTKRSGCRIAIQCCKHQSL